MENKKPIGIEDRNFQSPQGMLTRQGSEIQSGQDVVPNRRVSAIFQNGFTPPPAERETLRRNGEVTRQTVRAVFSEKPLSKLRKMSPIERADYVKEISEREQEKRWELTTGVKPENSRYILACPIYNETRMGPSVLPIAHALADVPKRARVDHVYVTNRCTDGSEEMVRRFMGTLGKVEHDLPVNDLGGFSFDPQLDPTFSMVEVGNQKHIHLNTKTGGKANVLRIITEMAVDQKVPIVMSHDGNVTLLPDGPMKLFAQAHRSFVRRENDAVVMSHKALDYFSPNVTDPLLRGTGLTPREIMPFGFLIPKEHKTEGKFFAWDPEFYSDRLGHGIPPSKLDDVVMGKQAERYGKKFLHLDSVMSYAWGPPTIEGRRQSLQRYTAGYLQFGNGLNLRGQSPELQFFEDESYRIRVLTDYMTRNKLEHFLPLTLTMWEDAIEKGHADYTADPHNSAFEGIEGAK